MTDVLVAIPAHDEVAEIAVCLEHVANAVRVAQATSGIGRVTVGVAAHRCTDNTFDVVVEALSELPCFGRVTRDDVSETVGEVRAGLVTKALGEHVLGPERVWLFNTDADSHVPPDWIVSTLQKAGRRRAAAVTGMVELRGWDAPLEALKRYRSLIDAGVRSEGHTHVYGANLAVRMDAYRRVGGFRAVHGEDQDLVDRLHLGDERVLSLLSPLVRTSARHPGRAEHGLGALLHRLVEAGGPDDPSRAASALTERPVTTTATRV